MGVPVAVGVGLVIAVQAAVLSRASTQFPALAVSLGLQVSGVLVAAVWATARDGWSSVVRVAGSWWWIPLGAAGWLVVAALGVAAARLGVAPALAIVVVIPAWRRAVARHERRSGLTTATVSGMHT